MANRKEHLQALIIQALDTPKGTILTVSGDQIGRRQLAIAALTSAKRELLPDVPEVINITIRAVAGNDDEIAIIHLAQESDLIEV